MVPHTYGKPQIIPRTNEKMYIFYWNFFQFLRNKMLNIRNTVSER